MLTVEGFGSLDAQLGESLLEVCERHGVPMESACGGFACCNSCRVEVLHGAELLSPTRPEESPFLDREGQRLGCQATLLGAVSIRLSPGL